jgi:hypothetical protein
LALGILTAPTPPGGDLPADSDGVDRVAPLAPGDDVDRRHGVAAFAGDLVVVARLSCRTRLEPYTDSKTTRTAQSGAAAPRAFSSRHL